MAVCSGWEFEDVMPPSSEDNYFIARGEAASSSIFDTSGERRSGDVAAIRSIPQERYIAWRNRNAHDRRFRQIVNRAKVA